MLDQILRRSANGKCFTAIEQAVLDAVGGLMKEPYGALYRIQLSLINEVQRYSNGKECNFYTMRMFQQVRLPVELELPQPAQEYELGVVTLQNAEGKSKVRAKVFVVNGRVFCINFDKTPTSLNQDFNVADAVISNSPDVKTPVSTLPADTALPGEYLELLKKGRDQINGWQLSPEDQVREVFLDEDNLCVFAEKANNGIVGVRSGDKAGCPVYVNYEDCQTLTEVEGSLTEFFESVQK